MKEGLLLLLTLVAVTYLCWLIVKGDKARAGRGKGLGRPLLGVFAHKDDTPS